MASSAEAPRKIGGPQHRARRESSDTTRRATRYSSAPEVRSGPRGKLDARLGLLALVAVAAFPVIEALRIIVQGGLEQLYGDQALIELASRRAWHFDQLLGPYSRYGFHHPGPLVFYLLSPFVRLLEPSGPGAYLGATVLNGAFLVATAIVIWRRVGGRAALWAAVVIDLYVFLVGTATFREPWNPYLVVAPMALFTVLVILSVTGTKGAWMWAAVVGSYAAQTHISTLIYCVALLVVATIWRLVLAVRADQLGPALRGWSQAWRRPACGSGMVALALVWVAPVAELFVDSPNNLTQMWRFATSGDATGSLLSSLKATATAITIIPFGNHDYVLTLNRSHLQLAAALVLYLVVGGVAVGLAVSRRSKLAVATLAFAVMGTLIGLISLSRAAGGVEFYFAVWLALVPLLVLLAVGFAIWGPLPVSTPASTGPAAPNGPAPATPAPATPAPPAPDTPASDGPAPTEGLPASETPATAPDGSPFEELPATGEAPALPSPDDAAHKAFWAETPNESPSGRQARRRTSPRTTEPWAFGSRATASLAALAVAMGALTVGADLHSRRVTQEILPPNTQANELTAAVLPMLTPQERWVKVFIQGADNWPPVAGVVLNLTRHGHRVFVEPTADFSIYFGKAEPPAGDTDVPFVGFYPAQTPPQDVTGGVVADVDGLIATFLPPSG